MRTTKRIRLQQRHSCDHSLRIGPAVHTCYEAMLAICIPDEQERALALLGMTIAIYGFDIDGGDYLGQPYAYTIGLAPRMPELVLFGLCPHHTIDILHKMVNMHEQDCVRFESDHTYYGIGSGPLYVHTIGVARYQECLSAAISWHRHVDFPCLQVCWSDANGRFPWEIDFEGFREMQPLLFEKGK